MKKIICVALSIFLISAFFLPVFADYYKDDIYRLNDFGKNLTDEENKALNDRIDGLVPQLGIDLPIYVFTSLEEGETLEERANYFYDHNGYGYGDNKSGVILAVCFELSSYGVFRYGDARELIDDDELESISSSFSSDYENDLSVYKMFANYLSNVKAAVTGSSQADIDKSDHADGMPYWYYEGDTTGFTDFHGENLPRVVDDADLFTDEQEATLNARMEEVVGKLGIGYALFTDDDNHGLSPEEYSSDFLHFGGYGVGDGYGAVVFYISMQPDNRCWRTTSINSYESIFTSYVTYQIDEMVDADIRAGRYYEAYLKHIDFVEELFENDGELTDDMIYSTSSDDSGDSTLICIIVGVVIGTIVGFMHLASCRKAMRVVSPVDAHEYLVQDSFNLRDKQVYYLYSTVTKTAKQKSSSGGGGSSYSSGSSSGGSYSSGGRSF